MSYVKRNLNPGEKIIFEVKRSILLLVAKFISAAVWLIIGVAVFALTTEPSTLFIVLVAILICIAQLIKYRRQKLTLTSSRLIFRSGIFSTRSVDILYEQIENVEIKQKFFGKIFHYSSIAVTTGALCDESIDGVIDGDHVKNIIMGQVDTRKKELAEAQAQMQAKAMREAMAAMQQPKSET